MPPLLEVAPRSTDFHPYTQTRDFSEQRTHPADVFSVLLILGDIVGRTLGQAAGGWFGPPSVSFGELDLGCLVFQGVQEGLEEITYMLANGNNSKGGLITQSMHCIAINGKTGYVRVNSSWVSGRMVRDYDSWMHDNIKDTAKKLIDEK
ncbi:hypothetical protein ASPWEDRAFT_737294 [Aspergillus wentii DTO 134E9]|uniref:Uncharacterized protein n=1 Tax=Aspergillus wentii DTO 134E9 TaxID=1073089 RepID=A0A1L9RNK0_ASPWE|nr:uncharacterized protein ASPWEDRAFT_737294 [Aspergillus wentii DTO 134E9]OJJ36418.1 hypothetical protein ASPWEDRAFT_737294 [Aspergillus wentii DTO 134E9]